MDGFTARVLEIVTKVTERRLVHFEVSLCMTRVSTTSLRYRELLAV